MWLITLILGAIVIFLANYWVNSQFNNWKKRRIPYHYSASPFRMVFRFIFTKKSLLELMKEDYLKLDGHKFGGFFQMFSPSIMIRDADLIHQVCIKDFSYFVDRNLPSDVKDLFSENVSSLTGDRWRTARHKLTPTFTSGKLKMMFDPIKESCDEVVGFINKNMGRDFDARDFSFKFVINVIGNVSFGLKVDAFNEETVENNEFLNVSRKFFQPSFMLMVKFMITLTMPKVRKYIKFTLIDEDIDKFFQKLVKDMIALREKTGEVRNDFLQLMLDNKKKEQGEKLVNNGTVNKATSIKPSEEELEDNELLDQLKYMQNGNDNYKNAKVFSDDFITSQTFLFISGGSETTAASLSFILYNLAIHQEIQKKVQEEIDAAISNHGFTYNSIKNLTYMEQVINESMRLNSATPFIGRMCTQDYKIPDTEVIIEKGTFVTLPVMSINLDPQYFSEPEKFDPDRFEDLDAIHPACLLSFGAGPRMCIAKRLAILEMKMFLAAILQQFTISLSPKTKLPLKIQKSSIFQHVDGGIWVKFNKRNLKTE